MIWRVLYMLVEPRRRELHGGARELVDRRRRRSIRAGLFRTELEVLCGNRWPQLGAGVLLVLQRVGVDALRGDVTGRSRSGLLATVQEEAHQDDG